MKRIGDAVRRFSGFFLLSLVMAAWLSRPSLVSAAVRSGLALCMQVMIPALFPFMVLCNLFVRRNYHRYVTALLRPVMGPLLGLDAAAAGALALGAVGGYPLGAATVFRLYDRGVLGAGQAARLLAFCNNAGPGFLLGVVGAGLFGSVRAGILLYAVHLLSALLVGAAARALCGDVPSEATERQADAKPGPFAADFVASVREAAGAMANVCAFLLIFSVLLAFLHAGQADIARLWPALGQKNSAFSAVLDGLLELSGGVAALGAAALPEDTLAACCSFVLGWGGLCVHCQTLSLRGSRPISMKPYFIGKLAQAFLAAVLTLLVWRRRPWAAAALAAVIVLLSALARRGKKTGKHAADRV